MPRLSEGGTALIRAWIEQAPEPKLVVIDVLAKVRDPRGRTRASTTAITPPWRSSRRSPTSTASPSS